MTKDEFDKLARWITLEARCAGIKASCGPQVTALLTRREAAFQEAEKALVTMDNPQETFESIRQWAVSTFGTAKPSRTIERANEEMNELLTETDPDKQLEEAADVVITLCNLPGLQEAVDRKMVKNRARKWQVMGDGTGYHVKEAV